MFLLLQARTLNTALAVSRHVLVHCIPLLHIPYVVYGKRLVLMRVLRRASTEHSIDIALLCTFCSTPRSDCTAVYLSPS